MDKGVGEQQEKVDFGSTNPSQSDYDEVDAAIMANSLQDENRVKLTGGHRVFIEQEKDSSAAIEGEDGSKSAVPKIEVVQGSTTLSDSSSDEDSDAREERKKKKLRKKKKTGEDRSDDDDLDELKSKVDSLRKENETMKERIENLSKEKTSLEESLQDERSKTQVHVINNKDAKQLINNNNNNNNK